MKREFRQFTIEDVTFKTQFNRNHLDGLKRYLEDPDKEKRVIDQECVCCYYSTKFGGAAMTTSQCGLCVKDMNFSSTCTDILCKECAHDHNLCKHCGADMDYKNRRKL